MGVLLAHFRLGYLGLWGAVIHALYIYSESLYQQTLGLALGPACLVSLAGIGAVLIPLISRYTRVVCPAGLHCCHYFTGQFPPD